MIRNLLFGRDRGDRWRRYGAFQKAYSLAQQQPVGSAQEILPLKQAFQRLGYGIVSTDMSDFWQKLVALGAQRCPRLQHEDVDKMEATITRLQPEALPGLCWLDLHRLCVGIGLFQPARVLREHSLNRMHLDAAGERITTNQLTLGLYAALELGHFREASTFLQRMEEKGYSSQQLGQAEWFVALLSGQHVRKRFGFEDTATQQDRDFGHYITGKRLALVGPVPSDVPQGPDIDSHDVVVKFSYRGGDKGRDPGTQGARLDISYYNNLQAETLASSDFGKVFSTIDWGVCINRKGRSFFPSDVANLRHIDSLRWLLPDTHFNAAPSALTDLLRFSPASIRVFNTDMMLSAGRFAGYLPSSVKSIDYTRSFIKTHDPILQYQFMHRLWELGYVTGDARFDEVMRLGLREYLDQLQAVHGANGRALL